MKDILVFIKGNKYPVVVSILLFIIGFQYAYKPKTKIERVPSDIKSLNGGRYLRFIYIGSYNCVYSNNPETHKKIRFLKNFLREYAHDHDMKYISNGISVDRNSNLGIKFLAKTGPYDVIVSGASWYNLGANYYVWKDIPGSASTPQVLITLTKYSIESGAREIGDINRKEKLLFRANGIQDIRYLYRVARNSNTGEIKNLLKI